MSPSFPRNGASGKAGAIQFFGWTRKGPAVFNQGLWQNPLNGFNTGCTSWCLDTDRCFELSALSCGNGNVDPNEECDDGNSTSGDGCDGACVEEAGYICSGTPSVCEPHCGNGTIDVAKGEQCDDNLGCCSASCQLEPDGTDCDDGETCAHSDQCQAGVCVGDVSPLPGCRLAGKGIAVLKNNAVDDKDVFVLKWVKAPETSVLELGNPLTTSGYELCAYDGLNQVLFEAQVSPGGTCDGKPCWKAQAKGYLYKDKTTTNDGIKVMKLKAGAEGKTLGLVKGKGANLPDPTMPILDPVTIQLIRSDDPSVCLESVFQGAAEIKKNNAVQFKGVAKAP